jgi:hypothetical protein
MDTTVSAYQDPYVQFLYKKSQLGGDHGFDPIWMPDSLFDFQQHLVEWALRKGKAAILADCGLGKTLCQLVWSENVLRKTNGRVLILTPLAVGPQTVAEGEKFGVHVSRIRDGHIGGPGIYVLNYDQLHKLNPDDWIGVACDESSILKHAAGKTQKQVTRFMSKIPHRALFTATSAPNDYTELGTSSEALGYLGYSEMLTRFFRMDDKKRHRMNDVKLARAANTGNYFAKLSYRVAQQIGNYRLKGHAEEWFWKWVSSWARACRKPSDLGFSDRGFILPELIERDHLITPNRPANGMLFTVRAIGLNQEREERNRTLEQRCEYVANLVDHDRPAIIWCHYNPEGDLLEKIIPGAVQVAGKHSDEKKEEIFTAFANGQIKKLITKPKIGGWGLNWQHCNHVVTFATHSYESYYQTIRRCWRFGQKDNVTVDIVSTEGEKHIRENMIRKATAMDKMFSELIHHMNDSVHIDRSKHEQNLNLPSWLSKEN